MQISEISITILAAHCCNYYLSLGFVGQCYNYTFFIKRHQAFAEYVLQQAPGKIFDTAVEKTVAILHNENPCPYYILRT
jgi:hypothetical protein